jgi:amino acid adenylation domain-containing protein
MSDITSKITNLSPQKRQLLLQRLAEKGAAAAQFEIWPKEGEAGDAPLSFGQQRLWFLEQMEPEATAYNRPLVLRLKGALDAAALEGGLNEIVRRHAALRMTFGVRDETPFQSIKPSLKVELPAKDLRHLSAAEREAQAANVIEEEARHPFSLTSGPLFRLALLRTADDEHLLLVVMHHIISDGWSTGVFIRELAALYESFKAGHASPLSELSIQYTDFAAWQRRWMSGEVLERELDYWKRQLAGVSPLLELPADRPRPAARSHRGATHWFNLPADLSASVKELAQQEGVSLFMTLLAAFNVLLHRYTRQDDILVGTPIANRNRIETEELIGFFVNTLVLRTDLSGGPTFRELLGRVREATLGAYAHQDLPFEKLVEELQPERNMSYTPLFQVMFVLQNAPRPPLELPGLTLSLREVESRAAQFDLTLFVVDREQGLAGALEYNTDLFDQATMARLVGHFQTLLEGIVARPGRQISELPLLPSDERHRLLSEWTETRAEYPRELCIHQLFEARAERTPDAVAVQYEDERLTCRELNERANQLAHYLRSLGVGPEVRVGLCVNRSPQMIVGILGILKAGAGYVPIDPSYPANRISYLLEDSQVPVLLTERALAGDLPRNSARLVCLDGEWEMIARESTLNPDSRVAPDNLSYVIYTSGSTGKPKGVLVTHGGLVHSTVARTLYYPAPVENFLLLSSFAFDSSVAGIFWTLCQGGTLTLPEQKLELDHARLRKLIARRQVSHLLSLPSLYALLLEEGVEQLASLKTVIVAGEACTPELVRHHYELLPRATIYNEYGPTEGTVWSNVYEGVPGEVRPQVPIGRAIPNTQSYILDARLNPVPVGVPGELHVGGAGVTRGYLNHPGLTAAKFIPDPFGSEPGARLYKTGDLARYLPDGNIDFLGRIDHQVKVRGFRIELGEIELMLGQHEAVRQAVVLVREDAPGDKRLAAYVVLEPGYALTSAELRGFLKEKLPEYMVPSSLLILEALPLTPNGKLDREALAKIKVGRQETERAYVAPRRDLEQTIADIWQGVLGVERVGLHDNFFDLGGHSFLLIKVHGRLREAVRQDISMVDLFKYPTVHSLAQYLNPEQGESEPTRPQPGRNETGRPAATHPSSAVAIIGMAGRFPGAGSVEEFWRNLRAGVESISFFTDEELLAAGVPPALLDNPNAVKARGILEGVELFDAAFFGITPREAEMMDPQQRLFLECAWEALENAGYVPDGGDSAVAVYAGVGMNSYLHNNIYSNPELVKAFGATQLAIANRLDTLSTRASYKLNLRGPSVTVQTTCSTSLVAVHLACQSILNGESKLALAGAVAVHVPQQGAYVYQEGAIGSPDGHCRAFDARGEGIVSGNGVGVLLLKGLEQALADGDFVHAVIKGTAINNDGALKAGYTAPSVSGQAEVITMAQAKAQVEPETITYVEAHGTATPLGDPIEVAALDEVFKKATERRRYCALGSVKTNIGHLDTAAGIAGLIKTVEALKHKEIPPSLHYEEPNPQINFADSAFYVNDRLRPWVTDGAPRRAGVSSFGIGGTNAHLVVEEAPARESSAPGRGWQLFVLSAASPTALDALGGRVADALRGEGAQAQLADMAYTTQVGRRRMARGRVAVGRDAGELAEALGGGDGESVFTARQEAGPHPVVFMFPGGGAQYVNMGYELYREEPTFREQVDLCVGLLEPHLGFDLREYLYVGDGQTEGHVVRLRRPVYALPALFVTEYALARLWMSWGVEPAAMIGHSLGEYVAACVAGVLPLDDALALVAERARMMQELPEGAMLAVPLPEAEVKGLLGAGLSLAAVNGPSRCVVSGRVEAVQELERRLTEKGVACRRLQTSHAFHSEMVEPLLERFAERVGRVRLQPPRIPYISNLTGGWITAAEATDPAYWARHLREAVRFADGLEELSKDSQRLLLEVGPGQTLSTLAKQYKSAQALQGLSSLPHPQKRQPEVAFMLKSLGRLWLAGAQVDWAGFHRHERRCKVPMPTYPFERKRYWVEPARAAARHSEQIIVETKDAEVCVSKTESIITVDSRRQDEILSEQRRIINDISGIDTEEAGNDTSFLELGLDSLLLMQVSQAMQNRFGVKIAFRQLFEEFSTPRLLAQHIAYERPELEAPVAAAHAAEPEPQAPPAHAAPPVVAVPIVTPQADAGGHANVAALERIIAQQINFMSQQLQLLRGGVLTSETAAPAAEPAPATQPPAQQSALVPAPASKSAGAEEKPFGPWRPIKKESSGGLSERQQAHLSQLIAKYTSRTRESKRLTQEYRQFLADTRTSLGFRQVLKEMVYPIVAPRSSGARIYDVDGNEYLDLIMGFGVNLFGHNPPFVREALEEQLRQGVQIGPQSHLAGKAARLMCELTGMERANFCNTGSEAVMGALRLARTVTGRNKIALFAGSYHGTTDGVLARGQVLHGKRRSTPIAPGIPPQMVEDVLVLDYGTEESLDILRAQAHELAAVLVEPVQSSRPELQPKAFLHEVRRLTEEAGAALIFDEMITGFRILPGGAQAWYGVQADIATYGKIIGGGMPIGAVAGKAHFMDAIDGGMWNYGDDSYPMANQTFFAGTFCKHPMSMAAAWAVLNHIKSEGPGLYGSLNERTAQLVATLNDYFGGDDVPMKMTGFGSLFRFNFSREVSLPNLLFNHMLENGVYCWEGRTCFLSTAHTDEDIAEIVRVTQKSVEEMRRGDFLPPARAGARSTGAGEARPASVPLTEQQKGIWVLTQMGEDASAAYNESLTLRLRGPLNLGALRKAIREVVNRHEALRATFGPAGDRQFIAPSATPEIPLVDFSRAGGEEREQLVTEWLANETRRPFDLEGGSPLRVHVLKLEAEHHLLAITVHHIVADGWSFSILQREIGALYTAECQGVFCELPEPMKISEYAVWQEQHRQSAEAAAAEAYWLAQYAGEAPVLELPTDFPRPAIQTYSGARQALALDRSLSASLKRLSAQHGGTVFMTLLAGFQLLLHRLSGQDDLAVGIISAGQASVGGEYLVGHCTNLLPLRSRLGADTTFAAYLASVKKTLWDAYEHQNYPFGTLIKKLNLVWDPSRSPLVTVVFNLDRTVSAPGSGSGFEGLEVAAVSNRSSSAKFDIVWNVNEVDGRFFLGCEYNTDLFRGQTIRRWIKYYEAILQHVAARPELTPDAFAEIFSEVNSQQQAASQSKLKEARLERFKSAKRKVISGPARGGGLSEPSLAPRL